MKNEYNIEQLIIASLDPTRLNLILFPTEKCNFRCTYCYEDFKIGKMSHDTRMGIKNLLKERFSDLEVLEISWFGGEPLLAMEVIEDISSYIVAEKKASLNYFANITTNGFYLSSTYFQKLIDYQVKHFQISIDGDKDEHDKSRVLANNKPTFDTIWQNILSISKTGHDFSIILRIHFFYETYNKLDSLIEKINTEIGNDRRFKIYFKAIERLGGTNDHQITKINWQEKQKIKEELDSKILNKQQILNKYDENKSYMCYASMPNSLMIRGDGRIGKCTVALEHDKNTLGRITPSGNLILNDNLKYWVEGIETLDKQMLACPLSKIALIEANEK